MEFYDINDNPIDHLTQWETGRKIKIKGLNPSKTYEAHVFNTRSKTAQVMSTVNSQGTITFEIIDRLLQEPYMITAVIHEKAASTSFAVARIEIPVEEAARPEKYVPTDPEKPPIAEYVLPIASDITLGGVKGKKKTSENVPVAVDAEGRMFVPPYPTGGGEVTADLSKVFALDSANMENVPSSGNLDNYKEPGNYHIPLSATVKNLPEGIDNKEGGAGYLKVMGSQYFGIQILYVFQYLSNPPWSMFRIYFRSGKYNQSSPWSNWKEIYTDNTDITRFVKSNLGALNNGKILGINAQGDVVPVEKPSGGGGSYTLPVANASTLGGVKAKTKTSGDTVEVSVDSAGKLFVPTYPTPSGGNSGTAKEYILIAKNVDVTDKIKKIITDANGQTLDLEEVVFVVKQLNIEQGKYLRIDIGGVETTSSGNSGNPSATLQLFNQGNTPHIVTAKFLNGNVWPVSDICNSSNSDTTSSTPVQFQTNDREIKTISEISMFTYDKSQYRSIKVDIYGLKTVNGSNVDEQKIVQDVLNALPTWDGGTY